MSQEFEDPDFVDPGAMRQRRGLMSLAQEVAELRAAYRDLPEQLAAAHAFEGLWDRFVQCLRPLVQAMEGGEWNPYDEDIEAKVPEVDDLRLELYSRQSTALPSYRDPLSMMLQTSLRSPSPGLYRLFGEEFYHKGEHERREVMSLAQFDTRVAEARADIVRHRLELEARIRQDGARLHELEDAVPRLVLASLRNLLWKNTRRRVVTMLSALLVATLAPSVRAALAALWNLVRSWFRP